MHEDYELKYWTKEIGVSKEGRLRQVVDKVGNSASAVRKELEAERTASNNLAVVKGLRGGENEPKTRSRSLATRTPLGALWVGVFGSASCKMQ